MRTLIVALAVAWPAIAHAEVVGKGVRAGVTTFSMKDEFQTDNATNTQPGFTAGGYLTLALGSVVSIQPVFSGFWGAHYAGAGRARAA